MLAVPTIWSAPGAQSVWRTFVISRGAFLHCLRCERLRAFPRGSTVSANVTHESVATKRVPQQSCRKACVVCVKYHVPPGWSCWPLQPFSPTLNKPDEEVRASAASTDGVRASVVSTEMRRDRAQCRKVRHGDGQSLCSRPCSPPPSDVRLVGTSTLHAPSCMIVFVLQSDSFSKPGPRCSTFFTLMHVLPFLGVHAPMQNSTDDCSVILSERCESIPSLSANHILLSMTLA